MYILLIFSLYWMTLEIILRRFFWHQVPTPIPSWFVYALIMLNFAAIPYLIRPLVDARKLGRS